VPLYISCTQYSCCLLDGSVLVTTSAITAQLLGSDFAVPRGSLRTVEQGRVSAKPVWAPEEVVGDILYKGMRNVG
jgi:hypothetical protein